MLPKSNASNDLLALLLIIQYVDGLPLARFEYVLGRAGVIVPRLTLARWVIGTAQALQPLVNLLRDTLLGAALIHMDETPLHGCSAVAPQAKRTGCSPTPPPAR